MDVVIGRVEALSVEVFADVLRRSGLAARRPVDEPDRLSRMLANADILVTARDGLGRVVGVARAVTDFAYCCYLSDLAVDQDWQGRGVGSKLISAVREAAGPESMCLLLAAPDAVAFYDRIGAPRTDKAFLYPRER